MILVQVEEVKAFVNSLLTCDVEIRDWSWRPVRSEDDTLAGAPRWRRMLTFLSLSARDIARGDVFPEKWCTKIHLYMYIYIYIFGQ